MAEILLKHPIIFKDRIIDRVIIGRLKVKHLKTIPESLIQDKKGKKEKSFKVSDFIPLLSAISDLAIEVVDEIDLEDLENISSVLAETISKNV